MATPGGSSSTCQSFRPASKVMTPRPAGLFRLTPVSFEAQMGQVSASPDRLAYGVQSMTAPLRQVLMKAPGEAFGRAFEDPARGFRHPVDLPLAQRQHAELVALLERLGVTVHRLDRAGTSPDLVYTFDTALVTDRGAIVLRLGKATRVGEARLVEAWLRDSGIPILGRIVERGTLEGGDCLWLRPDLLCVGRSLRTNDEGIAQLRALLPGVDVRPFDVPYAGGAAECLHLLSLISPLTEDVAAVYLPLLPAGLFRLLGDLGHRLVAVPDEEFATLGCNVLAVRPGLLITVSGNPVTRRALEAIGCEVRPFEATEIGLNGSGGPTCLTLPIERSGGSALPADGGTR